MSETLACQNHPTTPALDRCAGCAEPFCGNCIVDIYGARYCGSCKVMALKGQPMPEMGRFPCKEATTSLVLAIVSVFILFCPWIGFIVAGSSLAQAQKASQLLKANPQLMGAEKMRAARVISLIAMVLAVVLFILDKMVKEDGF